MSHIPPVPAEQITDRQKDAMEAIFQLAEAVGDELSIADLVNVMRHAVEDGKGTLMLCMAMVSRAATIVYEEEQQQGTR